MHKLERRWRRNWMKLAYTPVLGAFARRMAAYGLPPLYGAVALARWNSRGYISPHARLGHGGLELGQHCFIGDGALIYEDTRGGFVRIGNAVHLHENNTIQTGEGGFVIIGDETHMQPRCQISAYCGSVEIGARVEIAPSCAFYPYNHSMQSGIPIRNQPLFSRKGIVVGDDAWIGFGVILLDGAHVGDGAVIGAGSVVNSVIPADGVAVGSPARVIGRRPSHPAGAEAIA